MVGYPARKDEEIVPSSVSDQVGITDLWILKRGEFYGRQSELA
jgi:hypothetical protein